MWFTVKNIWPAAGILSSSLFDVTREFIIIIYNNKQLNIRLIISNQSTTQHHALFLKSICWSQIISERTVICEKPFTYANNKIRFEIVSYILIILIVAIYLKRICNENEFKWMQHTCVYHPI